MNPNYKITILKTISTTSALYHKDINVALERIKTGQDLGMVNKIRNAETKIEADEYKKLIPSFCFSGTFRQRNESGLIKHSGLCLLDFHNFKDADEIAIYRKAFIESKEKGKYTFAVFSSASNSGLKVLVKIPPSENDHKKYFKALSLFYNDEHLNKDGENVHQACFSSYDPELYVNHDSEPFVEMEINEHYDFNVSIPKLRLKTPIGIIQNLQKWFDKKPKETSLLLLTTALNDFGIPKHEAESYIQSKYGNKKNEKEISGIIRSAFKRPGGTKYFEDIQSLELLERLIKAGGSDKKKIYKKLADEGKHNEEEIDAAVKYINDTLPVQEFWWFDDAKCKIKNYKFKLFLEQNGFYKYYPNGSENFIFIKVDNNMIEPVTPDIIKNFTLKYLEVQNTIEPYEIVSSSPKMFKDDYLNLLGQKEITFYEDSLTSGVIYFRNGAAIVKAIPTEHRTKTKLGEKIDITYETKIELIDYLNINGYVFRGHIIDRDYELVEWKGCFYDKFITLVAGQDENKKLSIMSSIGYLMHSYKTSANNKAVILNDETISDNPNGGAGKGIFCAALGHMKRMVILDGKSFNADKSFAFQLVGADTQLLVFDDLPKNFNFEKLFSVVTEGITIEKKNKDAIKLSVGKSPKIIITTNYTIGGVGGSFERRKWELEFSSYFNANHTPLNEFGHMLFDEWSEDEWKKFDCFMIHCLSIYLEKGLVKQDFTNLAERKFIKETSFDFHEWVKDDPFKLHDRIYKKEYFEKFIEEYPDYKHNKWFTQKRFSMWLGIYGKYKGYHTVEGKDFSGRWIVFMPQGEELKQIVNEEMPIDDISEPKDGFDF